MKRCDELFPRYGRVYVTNVAFSIPHSSSTWKWKRFPLNDLDDIWPHKTRMTGGGYRVEKNSWWDLYPFWRGSPIGQTDRIVVSHTWFIEMKSRTKFERKYCNKLIWSKLKLHICHYPYNTRHFKNSTNFWKQICFNSMRDNEGSCTLKLPINLLQHCSTTVLSVSA